MLFRSVRNLWYLKKGGTAVVNTTAVKPVTESLKDTGYDGREMAAYLKQKCPRIYECRLNGPSKFYNIIMLGVAVGSGSLGLSRETLLKQIEKYVPAKYLDVNIRLFEDGIKIAGQVSGNPKGEE